MQGVSVAASYGIYIPSKYPCVPKLWVNIAPIDAYPGHYSTLYQIISESS